MPPCPVHVVGPRIVDAAGRTVFRDPLRPLSHEVKCAGRTVWVLFRGGYASNQEGYAVVRSTNGGTTWRLVATERYFGVNAPFEFDSYSGPWTIVGANAAYFVGWCPACNLYGTISLWVTRDGARHFRRYRVPGSAGFRATTVRVAGDTVTIGAKSQLRVGPRTRTFTVEIA